SPALKAFADVRALPCAGEVCSPASVFTVSVFLAASNDTNSAETSWVFAAAVLVALAAAVFLAGAAVPWGAANATPAARTNDSSRLNFFISFSHSPGARRLDPAADHTSSNGDTSPRWPSRQGSTDWKGEA